MTINALKERFAKEHPSLDSKYVAKIINIFFEDIKENLLAGNRVELRGLGAFSLRDRKARTVPHPRTQETLKLAEQKDVYFRASKKVEELLNA
jgi:integration host factor subunit beta